MGRNQILHTQTNACRPPHAHSFNGPLSAPAACRLPTTAACCVHTPTPHLPPPAGVGRPSHTAPRTRPPRGRPQRPATPGEGGGLGFEIWDLGLGLGFDRWDVEFGDVGLGLGFGLCRLLDGVAGQAGWERVPGVGTCGAWVRGTGLGYGLLCSCRVAGPVIRVRVRVAWKGEHTPPSGQRSIRD